MDTEPQTMTITEIIRANVWAIREKNRRDTDALSKSDADTGVPASRTWTQKEVAKSLGVSARTYGGMERDPKALKEGNKSGRTKFTVEELIHLARVLNCDVSTLLQPSRTLLQSEAIIKVPSVSGTDEGTLQVAAEEYALWLLSLQALPEQERWMFERLTCEPHDHGTKGDLRTGRVRRGRESQEFDPTAGPEKASVDDRAAIVSGWPAPAADTLDSSFGRVELARSALRAARKAIQIARGLASIDEWEGDSPHQAIDELAGLLDDIGESILAIAERETSSGAIGSIS